VKRVRRGVENPFIHRSKKGIFHSSRLAGTPSNEKRPKATTGNSKRKERSISFEGRGINAQMPSGLERGNN